MAGKRKKEQELEKYFSSKKHREEYAKKNRNKGAVTSLLIYSSIVAFLIFAGYLVYLSQTLPSLSDLENPKLEEATKIYSDNGEVIDKFYLKNRTKVTIENIPQDFVHALVATEDRKFFDHWGVDVKRIAQAFFKNLARFSLSKEGASTITQQLARNLYLNSKEVSLNRKLREAMTAVQIEKTYTKQEILAYYLNTVYFGKGSYGIEAAAQTYFNKGAKDLTLGESALLVGLLKSPTNYDPIENPENSKNRRNTVFESMYECRYITKEQFDNESKEPVKISLKTVDERKTETQYYDFTEYVRQELQKKAEKHNLDIYRDGLKVYTTLDTRFQKHAEDAIKEQLKPYQKAFNSYWNWRNNKDILASDVEKFIRQTEEYKKCKTDAEKKNILDKMKNDKDIIDSVKEIATTIQIAFVAMDVKTGNIKAMVGSNPYTRVKYGLNHVTQIKRQPGSSFKPFVYATAIRQGLSPAYMISNEPLVVNVDGKNWSPKGGGTGGMLSMRDALEKSVNVVAVRTVVDGIAPLDKVIALAHDMGINSKLPPFYPLALGAGEVSPLEITNAFGTFANEGIWVEPVAITRIEDRNGKLIEDYTNSAQHKEVLSEGEAYIMADMMSGVIDYGTATSVRQFFHRPAAGKTGTSQNYTDAWFIGFTPQFVAGVWLGFDDARINFGGSYGQGGKAAAPIWGRFMKYLYSDEEFDFPIMYFEMPNDVEEVNVCQISGLIANGSCPSVMDLVLKKNMMTRCGTTHVRSAPSDSSSVGMGGDN